MYGVQARKDGKGRAVPDFWQEHADAWLHGYDGEATAGPATTMPVGDLMEAEVDEAAVGKPDLGT
ncbi:hypothetical protein [Mesorhizobium sp. 43Arga]